MSFTDRFVQFPVKMINRTQADLLGSDKVESYDVLTQVLPMDICEYYPSTDDKDEEVVQLYMKNGRSFFVYLTIQQFEKLLNDHGK